MPPMYHYVAHRPGVLITVPLTSHDPFPPCSELLRTASPKLLSGRRKRSPTFTCLAFFISSQAQLLIIPIDVSRKRTAATASKCSRETGSSRGRCKGEGDAEDVFVCLLFSFLDAEISGISEQHRMTVDHSSLVRYQSSTCISRNITQGIPSTTLSSSTLFTPFHSRNNRLQRPPT